MSKWGRAVRSIGALFIVFGLILVAREDTASALATQVTSPADSGPGTLRARIEEANAAGAGPHTITFSLPHTITLASPLPAIAQAMVIDGVGGTVSGGGTVSNGFVLSANASTIKNLTIRGFSNAILINNASNNTIGGTGVGNTIVANTGNGVTINGASSTGNMLRGNFIGTDSASSTSGANNGSGVVIIGASNNIVGGSGSGDGNVISGNRGNGVHISGTTASPGNLVQGNKIGTNVSGSAALANGSYGVRIEDAANQTVGGSATGAGNVISGNSSHGVALTGATSTSNMVQGNMIGTNMAGDAAVGNAGNGVYISGAPGNTVKGNVISGNLNGVRIETGSGGTAGGNMLEENLIGVNAGASAALANRAVGVSIEGVASTMVGSGVAGAGNVISGNLQQGIVVKNATATKVAGNHIGTNVSGTALGNGSHGLLLDSASGSIIGDMVSNSVGAPTAAANTIASNGGDGIAVLSGTGNALLSNVIKGNTGLGIDLGVSGATQNDSGDADSGANNLQNFPVITGVGSGSQVQGTLNSAISASYLIQIFKSDSCDGSGFGEGQQWVASTQITTDGSVNGAFSVNLSSPAQDGNAFTATATADPSGNTSEFSACFTVAFTSPTVVVLVSGDAQVGQVGVQVGANVVIRVDDALARPVANARVKITASETPVGGTGHVVSSGTFTGAEIIVNTNASGEVSYKPTFSNRPGLHKQTVSLADFPNVAPLMVSGTANPGAPAALAFTQQPGGGPEDVPWAQQPRVRVNDSLGNHVTTATNLVTLIIGTGPLPAEALSCDANSVAAVGGIATFTNCKSDRAGSGKLTAMADGLDQTTSATFTVVPGAASQVGFLIHPTSAVAGANISVSAQIQDAQGQAVSDNTTPINLSITTGTGASGAALTCNTNPVTAANGTSNFTCNIKKSGTGYTLTVAAQGLTSAVSNVFDVAPAATALLAKQAGDNQTVFVSETASALELKVTDAFGNAKAGVAVQFQMASPSGATGQSLGGGGTAETNASGIATVSPVVVGNLAGGYNVTATVVASPTLTLNTTFSILVVQPVVYANVTLANNTASTRHPTDPAQNVVRRTRMDVQLSLAVNLPVGATLTGEFPDIAAPDFDFSFAGATLVGPDAGKFTGLTTALGGRQFTLTTTQAINKSTFFSIGFDTIAMTSTCSQPVATDVCSAGGYAVTFTSSTGANRSATVFVQQAPTIVTDLRVNVRNNAGAGLPGVVVAFNGRNATFTATTNASGVALLEDLPPGEGTVGPVAAGGKVTAQGQDFQPAAPVGPVRVPLAIGATGTFDFVLQPLASPVNAGIENRALNDVTVDFIASGNTGSFVSSGLIIPGCGVSPCTNGPASTATLYLPPGNYGFRVFVTSGVAQEPGGRSAEISGPTTLSGNFILEARPFTVNGAVSVLNDAGEETPASGVKVVAATTNVAGIGGNYNTTTDAVGRFTFNVVAGTYSVRLDDRGLHAAQTSLVVSPSGDISPPFVTIRAQPLQVKITAQVTLRGSGVDGALVTARNAATGVTRSAFTTAGIADVFVAAAAPGTTETYSIRVSSGVGVQGPDVSVGQTDVTALIALPETQALPIRVNRGTGPTPGVSGATISFNPLGTAPAIGAVTTDSSGLGTAQVGVPGDGVSFQYELLARTPEGTVLPLFDSAGGVVNLTVSTSGAVTSFSPAAPTFDYDISTLTINFSRAIRGAIITATSSNGRLSSKTLQSTTANILSTTLPVSRPAGGASATHNLDISVDGVVAAQTVISPEVVTVPGDAPVTVTLPSQSLLFTTTAVDLDSCTGFPVVCTPIPGVDVDIYEVGSAGASLFHTSGITDAAGQVVFDMPNRTAPYNIRYTLAGVFQPLQGTVTLTENQTPAPRYDVGLNRLVRDAADSTTISGVIAGLSAGETATIVARASNNEEVAIETGAQTHCDSSEVETRNHYCLRVAASEPPRTWTITATAANHVAGTRTASVGRTAVRNINITLANRVDPPADEASCDRGQSCRHETNIASSIIVELAPGALGSGSGTVFLSIQQTSDAPTAFGMEPTGCSTNPTNCRAFDINAEGPDGPITLLNSSGIITFEGLPGQFVAIWNGQVWKPLNCTGTGPFTCRFDHLSKFSVVTVLSAAVSPLPSAGGGGGQGGVIPSMVPTRPLEAGQAGSVSAEGVRIDIPAGAVTVPATARIDPASLSPQGVAPVVSQIEQTVPAPEGGVFGSRAFSFMVQQDSGQVVTLQRPVEVMANYSAADVSRADGDTSRIRLMHYDPAKRQWTDLKATRNGVAATLTASTTLQGLFAIVVNLPTPTLSAPAAGTLLTNMAPLLTWSNPGGTTQIHVQVIPANNDGPGINLIRNADTNYQVEAPAIGVGNYVMLPGMTYTWRVRTSSLTVGLGENDPGWSGWVSGTFKTAPPTSSQITATSPLPDDKVTGLTPSLIWNNGFPNIFYYEVQVSSDPAFGTGTFLYHELRHGGVTQPQNSYKVPDQFPLQAGTTYYWRVRPRVQGDGTPVAWSATWKFMTP